MDSITQKNKRTVDWLDPCIICAGRQEGLKEDMPQNIPKIKKYMELLIEPRKDLLNKIKVLKFL